MAGCLRGEGPLAREPLAQLSRPPPFPCPGTRQGHTEALEGCVAKLQRTKRPGRDELAALLPEVEGLPVQPEEGELLGRVVRKFDRWKVGGYCWEVGLTAARWG